MRPAVSRTTVFLVAALVRLPLAFLFFGSVDVVNFIDASGLLYGGVHPDRLGMPYLPGFHLLPWLAGLAVTRSPLPLSFPYKFIAILFDSSTAAIIGDRRGVRAGMFYAFAPVAILIVAFHGQNDAISLALLIASLTLVRSQAPGTRFAAGAAFIFAVIAKPIVAPFLTLIFGAPWRLIGNDVQQVHQRRLFAATAGGMAVAGLVWFAALVYVGTPPSLASFFNVIDYAEGGVRLFGFPLFSNRVVSLLPLLILVPLAWSGRVSREEAILMEYLFILSTTGIAPQYLCWVMPFLLLCRAWKLAAVYSLVAGSFLIAYYNAPNPFDLGAARYSNLATFSPLRELQALAPVVDESAERAKFLLITGDILLPLLCLACLIWRVIHLLPASRPDREPPLSTGTFAPIAAVMMLITAFGLAAGGLEVPSERSFRERVNEKAGAYAMVPFRGARQEAWGWVLPSLYTDGSRGVTAEHVGYVWCLCWSVLAVAILRGEKTRSRLHQGAGSAPGG